MKETNLISQIRNGEQKGFKKLYGYYPVIKKWLETNGCNKADSADIFQQALLVFCEKCQDESFELTASIDTYLFSVSKFVFYAKTRKNKHEYPSDFSELEIASSNDLDEHLEKEERLSLVFKALDALSERCRTILHLFYLKKKSMKEIAKQLKFKSEKVAKNQKYKCLNYAKQRAFELEQKIN